MIDEMKNSTEQEDKFSEKKWFEQNWEHGELDESKIESIFYFTVIWPIFERKLCRKKAQMKKDSISLASDYHSILDRGVLNRVFTHFRSRYLYIGGSPTDIFNAFVFDLSGDNTTKNKYKEEVLTTLGVENPGSEEKLRALLYISFRLRNNLYHGEKETEKLYSQNENFRQVNMLLLEIIKKFKEKMGKR